VLSQSLQPEFDRSFICSLSRIVYPQSRIILEMKRESAAEALKSVDPVCGEILLGRGTAMAYVGGSALKVREKKAVAEMSQFRCAISESGRADLIVRSASSFFQIPE
jgi:hypothetical protein